MRALFIGGTGNISTECAAVLHAAGHEVAIVSRGRTAVPREYVSLTADRKDFSQMRAALERFKADVALNFLGYDLSDVQLDFRLFEGKIQQYVFISSAAAYKKPASRLPITEESELGNPHWEYARKKIACERWLLEEWRECKFPVTIVRPSHTYSKRWVPNPVSSSSFTFCTRLEQGKPVYVPDEGDNPWTLTAAGDFAQGLSGLVGNPAALGEAFHITSDEVQSWNQIVAQIAEALGVKSPRVAKIPTDFICQVAPQAAGTLKGDKAYPGIFDNSKLKRLVPTFACRKQFREGVRESVEWLRAHPDQQNLSPAVDELCDKVATAWEQTRF